MAFKLFSGIRGRLMLFLDWLTRPAPIQRSESELRALARETRGMSLYECRTSVGCIKVRRMIRRPNMPLERRDIFRSQVYHDDLLAGLGRIETPCLRVERNGQVLWISEPERITGYLTGKFNPEEKPLQASH